MARLAEVCTFWDGPSLGDINAACLRSFVRHGHRVKLYAYAAPDNVPEGVELLPADDLFDHREAPRYLANRHFELFSDLFRYRLLGASAGLWVDTDCYCVRPIEDAPYIFGLEKGRMLNSAVLKAPADSPLVASLLAIDERFVPPWYAPVRRAKTRLLNAIGAGKPLAKMPWGTVGPKAVAHYARKHDVIDRALPADVFYPVHWDNSGLLLDPGLTLDDLVTSRTKVIHLNTSQFRRFTPAQVSAAGTPLDQMRHDADLTTP